jgi:uncharacterized 2Fe-2S/4Fe-4S cluster protein (DUF4445 family)
MNRFGAKELERVVLAGAFGSYIDKKAAMLIGLFPDCSLDKVEAVGNAAGDGARLALLNRGERSLAYEVARRVEYVELTTESSFQREFMMAMYFPHLQDEFPHLKHILTKIPTSPKA